MVDGLHRGHQVVVVKRENGCLSNIDRIQYLISIGEIVVIELEHNATGDYVVLHMNLLNPNVTNVCVWSED